MPVATLFAANVNEFPEPVVEFSLGERAGQLYWTQPIFVFESHAIVRAMSPLPSVEGASARFALASGLSLERVMVVVSLCKIVMSPCFAYAVICQVPDESVFLNS